jgi:hypothetical protein
MRKEARITPGAVREHFDVPARDPNAGQRLHHGPTQVEVNPRFARHPPNDASAESRFETSREISVDLKAARPDGRPDSDAKRPSAPTGRTQGANGLDHNLAENAAPPRVNRGHLAPHRVFDEDRQTIGRAHADSHFGCLRDDGVCVPDDPRRADDPPPVELIGVSHDRAF